MSARSRARFIIFLRSSASAFLLSLSSSGGIALNAASIAMSFASAKLTFISCSCCSIFSKIWLDKSISEWVNEPHYAPCTGRILRHSSRPASRVVLCRPERVPGFIWGLLCSNAGTAAVMVCQMSVAVCPGNDIHGHDCREKV